MKKVEVTQDIMDMLGATLERTRLNPLDLDRAIRKKQGRAYAHDYVDVIYKGKTELIPAEVWETIKKAVSSMPDAPKSTGGKATKRRDNHIPLTDELSGAFKRELKRTKANLALLERTLPQDLRKGFQDRGQTWKNGKARTVNQDVYEHVMDALKALSDKKTSCSDAGLPPSKQEKPYITIREGLTPLKGEDIETIKHHRKRTGVPYTVVLAGVKSCPEGLSSYRIRSWVSGAAKSANPKFVRFVIETYQALPDRLNF